MVAVAVENQNVLADEPLAVGRHFADAQHAFQSGARPGPTVDQIGLTVVVPQRAGVDDAQHLLDEEGFRPLAARVLRLGHVDADVGIAPIDIIPTVVEADGRRPDPLAVAGLVEMVVGRLPGEDGVDDFPVHQVGRMENLQPRGAVERRGSHPEIVARAGDVGVGIIGVEHGILVLAVAQIGRPDGLCRNGSGRKKAEKQKEFFHRSMDWKRPVQSLRNCSEPVFLAKICSGV